MLQKIISIQNTGKFKNYQTAGNVEFDELTLIYGGNGLGKTTLASIFRSLNTNNDVHIAPRKEVNNPDGKLKIKLYLDKEYKYEEDKGWNGSFNKFMIFDNKFVNENVYSGETVDHAHKKNLYYFVVGNDGVQLAKDVERLVGDIRDKINEIKEKGTEIEENILWKGEVKDFVSLSKVDNLDEKISETEKEIAVLNRKDIIKSLSNFEKIELEELDVAQYLFILGKELDDVSSDAEEKVKKHVDNCLGGNGEKWLEKGLHYYEYSDGDECPFCGQTINVGDFLSVYKQYFSQAYSDFKDEINICEKELGNYFSQNKIFTIQRKYEESESLLDRWKEYIDELQKIGWTFDGFVEKWNLCRDSFLKLFEEKKAQPLENLSMKNGGKMISALFDEINDIVVNHNIWVDEVNKNIKSFRGSLGEGDIEQAKNKLVRLQCSASGENGKMDIKNKTLS
jgi:wobble nucleotide-excising tRNase